MRLKVDCWYALRINPYDHLICQTPPFRLWLGIVEYLFNDQEMLDSSIEAALYDKDIRGEDLNVSHQLQRQLAGAHTRVPQFYSAAQGWAQCVALGSMEGYHLRFEDTAAFFQDRLIG